MADNTVASLIIEVKKTSLRKLSISEDPIKDISSEQL